MRSHWSNYNYTKSQNQTMKRVKAGKQTLRREKTNVWECEHEIER